MNRSTLFLKTNDIERTADLIDSDSATPIRAVYHIQGNLDRQDPTQNNEIFYELDNEQLWNNKIDEIRTFQREKTNANLNNAQIEQLIEVYNRYRHVLPDTPGKVRGYQCKIEFKETANFNRKSYPSRHSLKEAVRTEINRLIGEDIIKPSYSLYTSPILAVPKKNGKVRICLDAREINKVIVNDRTSLGEIEEVPRNQVY